MMPSFAGGMDFGPSPGALEGHAYQSKACIPRPPIGLPHHRLDVFRSTGVRDPRLLRPQDAITMSRGEIKMISDSLRRAYSACDAAHQLCAKASRAFSEECTTILECKSMVDGYLLMRGERP